MAYPPRNLGRVSAAAGGGFTRKAALIYGDAQRDVLAALSKVNPDVKDWDAPGAGRRIVLPALTAEMPPPGARLVRVGRALDAESGLEVLEAYSGVSPGLRLFVRFHPSRGLVFDVIVDNVFLDPQAARSAVAGLPPGLAESAVVEEAFEKGTLFYTRLGAVGAKRRPTADEKLAARDLVGPGPL
ncbi:hypothetical protein [Desulfolutivibrio sulfoxidireducens]|uniref:hypothetical protein n=1 Tax=Desulfolutivibrio sulfoxidireducens TaxID=2773299 RepID=UPI00159E01E4|nr:hypothetical protein [Desulfolutivibrio sulfoxidireducens]QLA14835.1 hypothetical protein GD605_01085 [Desulfolutivibrio sulfoxidireducens]QLA18406.1 hypothetical protein GD604_01020 [Desulfolutivibrio sulfoxidireducens]